MLMLNLSLNCTALAVEYGVKRRLLIRDILTPEIAASLEHCLLEEVPWGLSTLLNGKDRNFQAQELQVMSSSEWQSLVQRVQADARSNYQFLFNNYHMITAYRDKRDPGLFLHRFLEFLNGPSMLEFVRRVTGHDDIRKADAQATRYMPGHFLRTHNDLLRYSSTDTRRAAYVLNLTRNWQADWGGQLQFLTDKGEVEESWIPGYNTLALFGVPVWHCVSPVGAFAAAPRLAITGWFRTH